MDIILYLLHYIQYQQRIIRYLFSFLCRYIPLRQWAFEDSHSPKHQKFKTDALPLITDFRQGWSYKELIPYFEKRYGKKIRPITRRSECDIRRIAAVLAAMPQSLSCTKTMAPKGRFSARSATPDSPPKKAVFPPSSSGARTVQIPLFQRKNASTSSSISVSTPSALIIFTIFVKLIKTT